MGQLMIPPARAMLYYDDGCGPCTFFARTVTWASHRRLDSIPLASPKADIELAGMSESARFDYAHLREESGLLSGADIMAPLVGLTFGKTGARMVRAAPPVDRSLRWLYHRFWAHRMSRGCAPDTRTNPSGGDGHGR
ncbi:MAG: hypothetical protein ACHQ2Y_05145 [Candidatus Lutacidiplasmatales archaeon]